MITKAKKFTLKITKKQKNLKNNHHTSTKSNTIKTAKNIISRQILQHTKILKPKKQKLTLNLNTITMNIH